MNTNTIKKQKTTRVSNVVKTQNKTNKIVDSFNALAGILKEEIEKGIVKPFNRKELYGN